MSERRPTEGLVLIPPAEPGIPPYANATFMFSVNTLDINILFMRMPLMTDIASKARLKKGQNHVEGHVVGSITLPREAARQMAARLKELLDP
jgi:hypothetical protein